MSASLSFAALLLAAAAVSNTSYEPPDGGFVLRHEAIVPATPEAVWEAISTGAGWESWAVPFARIELRLGGRIETSYDPLAEAGDPANILSRILAWLPGRMIAFQAEQAPPGFPHPEQLQGLFSVLEVVPHGQGASRVSVSGVGYTDSPAHLELRAFFEQGNAWTLERLVERFSTGPADWSTLTPTGKETAVEASDPTH
jgi:uncharacterized protein YndB with AHSA1/START domain